MAGAGIQGLVSKSSSQASGFFKVPVSSSLHLFYYKPLLKSNWKTIFFSEVLKDQCHEIFTPQFFTKLTIRAPDWLAKVFSNMALLDFAIRIKSSNFGTDTKESKIPLDPF